MDDLFSNDSLGHRKNALTVSLALHPDWELWDSCTNKRVKSCFVLCIRVVLRPAQCGLLGCQSAEVLSCASPLARWGVSVGCSTQFLLLLAYWVTFKKVKVIYWRPCSIRKLKQKGRDENYESVHRSSASVNCKTSTLPPGVGILIAYIPVMSPDASQSKNIGWI